MSEQQALTWSWPVLESVKWSWAVLGGLPSRPEALAEGLRVLRRRWGGERNRLVEPVHPREPRLAGELSMEKEVWTLGQEFPEREMCEVMLRGPVILRLGVDIGRAPFDVTIK